MVREPVAGWHQHHPGGRWCQPNGGDPAERPSDAPLRGSPPLHHVHDVRGPRPLARTFSATTSARRFRTVLAGALDLCRHCSPIARRAAPANTSWDHGVKTGWMPCLCAPAREAAGRGRGPRASPAALPGAPPGAPRHDALRAASPNQAPAGCSITRAHDRLADPSLTRQEPATGRHAGPVIRSRSATGASQRQCASIRLYVDVVGRHRQRSRPDQVVVSMASAAPVRFLSLALAARSSLYGGDVPVSSAHMARRPSWTAGRLRRDRSGSCAGGRSEPAREHQTVMRRRPSRRAAGRGRRDGAGEGQRHQSGREKAEPADCEEAGRLGVAGEVGEHRAADHQGDGCAAQDRRRKSGAD